MIKSLILMFQFFTRIPIPIAVPANPKSFRRGVVFLPLVGAVIGIILAGINYFIEPYISPLVASIVIVIAEIILTGGLHLDGLADSFDGLYSARKKERMLEIMKDSHIGTYGVIALIMTLMLKVAIIYTIPASIKFNLLLVMPIVSRFGVVFLGYRFKYAREDGLGNWLIGNVAIYHVIVSAIVTGIIVWALFDNVYLSIFFVGIAVVFAQIYGYRVKKQIDGITGDILGSYIELMEVLQLFCYMVAIQVFIS